MKTESQSNRNPGSPRVGIVMGSDSDLNVMKEAAAILEKFDIPYDITVASAHRTPQRAGEYATSARDKGMQVIIAGAGHAAHLAGVLAAHTTLPIIGVPIDSSCLQGMDALLSTVQMPPGVPVATVSIGKSGARNAGILAAQILALADADLEQKLTAFKQEMAENVAKKAEAVKGQLKNRYRSIRNRICPISSTGPSQSSSREASSFSRPPAFTVWEPMH